MHGVGWMDKATKPGPCIPGFSAGSANDLERKTLYCSNDQRWVYYETSED